MPNDDANASRRPKPVLRQRARELRRRATTAEARLWHYLRGGKLGVKVRRQHPIGPFIADFCIVERRLIIEIDGEVHTAQAERDAERSAFLEADGYRVLRVANARVLDETDAVLAELRAALDT